MEQTKMSNGAVAHESTEKNYPSAEEYLRYVQEQKKKEGSRSAIPLKDFVFCDEKMQRIVEIVEQIANANVPVLISGEAGTGKEVIARLIHEKSNRSDQSFNYINCASTPRHLIESEMFGFEKGAVLGAESRHVGKFEANSQGTLLLDEVTETDPDLQAKLLRVLQDKEIERIGGHEAVPVNTRIIATSNRDIASLVREGKFRQDLYYRLYVIHIEVPPLRQRPKDVEALARKFLAMFSTAYSKGNLNFSADAMNKLLKYPWPGNVRELQNVIQRAVLMSTSNVLAADEFNLEIKSTTNDSNWIKTLPVGVKMREVERAFIIETLKYHSGNRTHSAKTLGISLRTLRNKINEFSTEGFDVPSPTSGKAL